MKRSKKSPSSKFLKGPKDPGIDFSDIPETDEAFWADADVRIPVNKKGVYVRIDPETLKWFKKQGRNYQTLINAVLKKFIESQKR